MKLLKTVVVGKPLDAVFSYLSDFTTTTDWDPGTATAESAPPTSTPQHSSAGQPS